MAQKLYYFINKNKIERAMGDGIKKFTKEEKIVANNLRQHLQL